MPFTLPSGVPIRIISNLSTQAATYVIGFIPYYIGPTFEGYHAVLRPLATVHDDSILFSIEPHGADGFRLKWGGSSNPYRYLTFASERGQLYGQSAQAQATIFAVDSAKDGNWFALNDSKHMYVVDVEGGSVADKTPILQWKWNGGDNQCWRFEQASS